MCTKPEACFENVQVPGHSGNFLLVRDALRKPPSSVPFPTFFAPEDEDVASLPPLEIDQGDVDPFLKD